jgi:hypothetical protein
LSNQKSSFLSLFFLCPLINSFFSGNFGIEKSFHSFARQ